MGSSLRKVTTAALLATLLVSWHFLASGISVPVAEIAGNHVTERCCDRPRLACHLPAAFALFPSTACRCLSGVVVVMVSCIGKKGVVFGQCAHLLIHSRNLHLLLVDGMF